MQIEAKLTTNERVTIPAKFRKVLDLKPGDKVTFEPKGDGRFLLKKTSIKPLI